MTSAGASSDPPQRPLTADREGLRLLAVGCVRMHHHTEVTFCTHSLGNFRQRPQLENIVLDLVQKLLRPDRRARTDQPVQRPAARPCIGGRVVEMI